MTDNDSLDNLVLLFERMLPVTPTRRRDAMHDRAADLQRDARYRLRAILVELRAIVQGTAGWLGLRFQA